MKRHPLRALAAALLLALAAPLACDAADTAGPAGRAADEPILFVHGFTGRGANWNTMAGRFRADGWPADRLDRWNYDSAQSNVVTAELLAAEVDRLLAKTGADKVDLVTHSMGGLSSRYYAKHLGGAARIDSWVSLGGPNHGAESARLCDTVSCTEMRIGSDFLDALNRGDETPGSAHYATWWSPCDPIVNPDSSVAVEGATSTRTGCLTHTALITDRDVYRQVRDIVAD